MKALWRVEAVCTRFWAWRKADYSFKCHNPGTITNNWFSIFISELSNFAKTFDLQWFFFFIVKYFLFSHFSFYFPYFRCITSNINNFLKIVTVSSSFIFIFYFFTKYSVRIIYSLISFSFSNSTYFNNFFNLASF